MLEEGGWVNWGKWGGSAFLGRVARESMIWWGVGDGRWGGCGELGEGGLGGRRGGEGGGGGGWSVAGWGLGGKG